MSNNTKTENWVAFKDPDGDWHVRIEGDDGDWICSLSWFGQSEERARLLAAAPEMLEALKELAFRANLIDQDNWIEVMAVDAIAKAEGQA